MTIGEIQKANSAQNIRDYIRRKNMSYDDFASVLGIGKSVLVSILNREMLIPRCLAVKLAEDFPDGGDYTHWRGITTDGKGYQRRPYTYARKNIGTGKVALLIDKLIDMAVKHESEADMLCRDYEFGIADGIIQAVHELQNLEVD